MPKPKDAVFGCILGHVVGDALGEPVEFSDRVPKEIPKLSPVNNHFTDDTQMMVAIAEALFNVPPHRNSEEAFMEELCRQYVEWKRHPLGGSHRAPGASCLDGAMYLAGGKAWNRSGALDAKGNGPTARASVIGALYYSDLNLAWRIGCLSAVPTHNNLEPILCGGAVALLCAASIAGIGWPRAVQEVLTRIENWEAHVPYFPREVKLGSKFEEQNPWYAAAHLSIAYILGHSAKEDHQFYDWNGNDFASVPATAAAIYYNTRYSTFRDVAMNCARWTLDSDSTTAIACAIAGARFGVEGIPYTWRGDIELSTQFHNLADKVWEASLEVGQSAPSARSGAA